VPSNLSRPNSARVIDYFLGGDHNYAIDRQFAQKLEEAYPGMGEAYRIHRRFLNRAVTYLIWKENIRHFVRFRSGLPTCGNLHEVALFHAPDARVVYSDPDPAVVQYGEEIIAGFGLENVRYLQGDPAQPEILLENPAVSELFGEDRRIGVALSLPYVMEYPALAHSLRVIYDWVAPGSHLILGFANEETLNFPELVAIFRAAGPFYLRSSAEMAGLVAPWRLSDHGVCYAASWPSRRVPETGHRISSGLLAYKP